MSHIINFFKRYFLIIAVTALSTYVVVSHMAFATNTAAAAPTPAVAPAPAPVQPQQPEAQYGKVISVEPVYDTKITPKRVCQYELRRTVIPTNRAIDGSGTIVGGLAGGVIGNRIGKGNGNIAATIGGAILGSVMGNGVEREMNRPAVRDEYVKVCHTKQIKETYIKGYNVTYTVNGENKTVLMKDKPVTDQIRLELAPAVNS